MKLRLESSVFKEKTIVRTYSKDFLAKSLCEECIHLRDDTVNGTVTEIRLNRFCVNITDLSTPEDCAVRISNDCSLFKLHFELEGLYSYTPHGADEPLVVISEGHFNMYYLSKVEGIQQYRNTPSRSLEILFTENFIKAAVGDDYKKILQNKFAGNEKGDFTWWAESQPIKPGLQQDVQEIMQCKYSGQLKKTYLETKITGLLIHFLMESGDDRLKLMGRELAGNDYSGIMKVEEYIRQNLKESMTISELATIAGINTSKLKQHFKKVFSTTIFKYITGLRMEKAKELIQHEGLTISEASYEVGYKNPQHFTVAFKKYYGYLPSSLVQ